MGLNEVGEDELKGWTVSVVGGDTRMLEHMRLARLAGAKVQHYGSIPNANDVAGEPQTASLAAAVKGARIISCPIPGLGADDEVYAKYTTEKLRLTTDVLKGAAPGAMLFTCYSTPRLDEWAKAASVKIISYGEDDALSILHAVPTAEGAIRVAIENTDDTLLGMNVLCVGLGRVGVSVAQAFEGMKSRVSLAVRNPAQLARAWAMNTTPIELRELKSHIGIFGLIVSSTSGRVLDKDLLASTRPDVVIIDLCSPPGSVDFEAAKALGRKVIWARAQAGRAPRRAGADEWHVLMRILREQTPELRRS
jgi:dipicolinate synthase subunit A